MPEKRIAVFPGSFDPITKGHEDIILRGARLFDELIVAIGENENKTYLFDKQQRLAWIRGNIHERTQCPGRKLHWTDRRLL